MPETSLEVIDPFSGEKIEKLPFSTDSQVQKSIEELEKKFTLFKTSSAHERSQALREIAQKLEENQADWGHLISREAGKPITLAQIEVQRAIDVFHWASAEALRFSGELLRTDTTANSKGGLGIATPFPRGIILGITPFNFPLNLVAHKVAPAIACGCVILVKPSPFTPLSSLRLAKLIQDILPDTIKVLLATDGQTAKLTQNGSVSMVSFTGSANIGWKIKEQAWNKPTTLELGGNAWTAVFEDVPKIHFQKIATQICKAAFGYAGQSCISIQNIALEKSIASEFSIVLEEEVKKFPFGDPKNPECLCGPVIHRKSKDRIQSVLDKAQLTKCIKSDRLVGAARGSENLLAPHLVFVDSSAPSNPSEKITQEEIFGPVAVVHEFESLDQLVDQIQSGPYGLQAGVFTDQTRVWKSLYEKLDVGGLVVNGVSTTRYDHQPYGGVKDSGFGREGISYAMHEMTEIKFLSLSAL